MKKFWCLGALLLLGGCRLGQFDVDYDIKRYTLNNGIHVLLVPISEATAVSYQTWVRVGSVDEKQGQSGLAHLFEHLMFRGTGKVSAREFFKRLEAKGVEVSATTTRDYTQFYDVLPPELLPDVIELEADRFQNLIIDEQSVKSEIAAVLEERRIRTDKDSSEYFQEALWAAAFRTHPYRNPVLGFPGDLIEVTEQEALEFFKKHYVPSALTLVVAGKFDVDFVLEQMRQYYEKIPSHPIPLRDWPEESPPSGERRITLHQGDSRRLEYGYRIVSGSQPDSYALDVLAQILFEGSTSRMVRSLVQEKKLALAVAGTAFTPRESGLFLMSFVSRGGVSLQQLETEAEAEIKKLQNSSPSSLEVQAAVKRLTVELMDSVRSPHGIATFLGLVQTLFGDTERFAADLKKYLEVTPEQVQQVARKYLHPNGRTTLLVEPEK